MWQPEQPSSQTVASVGLRHRWRPRRSRSRIAAGTAGTGRRVLAHLARPPCPSRRARRSGRPGRTCRSWCTCPTRPRAARSVMTRASMPAAHDVPGVGALDLVADPDAARAQDAAVVVDREPLVRGVDVDLRVDRYGKSNVVTPSRCARDCSSQWPLATQTEQMWLRSANSSSRIILRYSLEPLRVGRDLHALLDARSTQAGSSSGVPLTSTRHSRQAPTSDRPSRWQSVGTDAVLAGDVEDRLVLARADVRPSIVSVDLDACGRSCARSSRWASRSRCSTPAGQARSSMWAEVLVAEVAQRAEDRVRRRLARGRTGWCR